eukprot:comp22414_c0_seq1/m.33537 comp22414_c0_seq1/g.33537  ORF comp22414_c0_seq1/g.33537 comp22414_c0_seq1/m.33537 type:complete len:954 (-) comp22414_c0_seq1:274-3135(-)
MFLSSLLIVTVAYMAGFMDMSWYHLIVLLGCIVGVFKRRSAKEKHTMLEELQENLIVQKNYFRDHESCEWFNQMFCRLWKIFQPTIATGIRTSVEASIAAAVPQLKNLGVELKFSNFFLGERAPWFSYIKYYPTEPSLLRMDMGLELEEPEAEILLEAHIKGRIYPIARVSELSFRGPLRVEADMADTYPCAHFVRVGFLEEPTVDFTLELLRVNLPTGIKHWLLTLTEWRLVSNYIAKVVQQILTNVLVDPNKIDLNLLTMLVPQAGPKDIASGVLLVNVYGCENLPKVDMLGSCDPFVKLYLGKPGKWDKMHQHTLCTEHKTKEMHPSFQRSFWFPIYTFDDDAINIRVYDDNPLGHRMLGEAELDLNDAIIPPLEPGRPQPTPEQLAELQKKVIDHSLDLHDSGKESGRALIGARYIKAPPYKNPDEEHKEMMEKVMANLDLNSEQAELAVVRAEQELEALAETEELWQTGMLRVYVHSFNGVRNSRGASRGVFPVMHFHMTQKISSEDKSEYRPTYDQSKKSPEYKKTDMEQVGFIYEALILSRDTARMEVEFSSRGEHLARLVLDVGSELKTVNRLRRKEFKLDSETASVFLSMDFVNLDIGDDVSSSAAARGDVKSDALGKLIARVKPGASLADKMGMLTLVIHKATGVKAADFGGKSDPFVKVHIKDIKVVETQVIKETLEPKWEETFKIPLPTITGVTVNFDLRDWDQIGKDDNIGNASLDLDGHLMTYDEFGRPSFRGWLPITYKNKAHGEIEVSVFYEEHGVDSKKRVIRRNSTGSEGEDVAPMPSPSKLNANKRTSLVAGQAWGRLFVEVVEAEGLPEKDFTPIVRIRVDAKTEKSVPFQTARTVTFNFERIFLLARSTEGTSLNVRISNKKGGLFGSSVAEYTMQDTPLSTWLHANAVQIGQKKSFEATVELTANEKAKELCHHTGSLTVRTKLRFIWDRT